MKGNGFLLRYLICMAVLAISHNALAEAWSCISRDANSESIFDLVRNANQFRLTPGGYLLPLVSEDDDRILLHKHDKDLTQMYSDYFLVLKKQSPRYA